MYEGYLDTILSSSAYLWLIPPEHYRLTLLYCGMLWNMRGFCYNLLGAFSRHLPDDARESPIPWLLSILCICSHFPDMVDSINLRLLMLDINVYIRSLRPRRMDISEAIANMRYTIYVRITSMVAQDGVTPIEYRDFVEYIGRMVNDICVHCDDALGSVATTTSTFAARPLQAPCV